MSTKLGALFLVMKGNQPQANINQMSSTTIGDDWYSSISEIDENSSLNFYIHDEDGAHYAGASSCTIISSTSSALRLRFDFGGSIETQDIIIEKCSIAGGTGHNVNFQNVSALGYYEFSFWTGDQAVTVAGFRTT